MKSKQKKTLLIVGKVDTLPQKKGNTPKNSINPAFFFFFGHWSKTAHGLANNTTS